MYEHIIVYSTYELIDNSAEDVETNRINNLIFRLECPFRMDESDFNDLFEERMQYEVDEYEDEYFEINKTIIRKINDNTKVKAPAKSKVKKKYSK